MIRPADVKERSEHVRGPAGRPPHVPGLDGVRALAVTFVLLYHAGLSWMPGGYLGVDVFFALSGYLITSLLLAEFRTSGRIDLGRFWLRRARRLLPAAVLVIVLCLVVVAIGYPSELAKARGDALASLLYVNNWHQLLGNDSYFESFGRPSTMQHLWSLAVEEQFYLLWPLIIVAGLGLLGRRWTFALTVGLGVLSALLMGVLFDPGRDASRVYFGTDAHAAGLLTGAAVAFLWPLGRLTGTIRPRAVAVLDGAGVAALALLILAATTWQDFEPWVYRGGIVVAGIAATVLVAVIVHPASRLAKVFGLAPLVWIGKRSYGIYLFHWPVMVLTRPGVDLEWSTWVLVPLQIAVTVGLAAASYRWIEMPIRRGEAGPAIRAWLDRRAPRRRLAFALTGMALLTGAAVAVAARPVPEPDLPPNAKVEATAQAKAAPQSTGLDRGTAPTSGDAAGTGGAKTAGGSRKKPGGKALAVGASVMLGSQGALGSRIVVDAAVGRQAPDIIARLQAYRDAGKLPSRVIVQIGENGPLLGEQVRGLKKVLRGVDRVVLINVRVPRSWETETNGLLDETVENWPQARLADWFDASTKADELYDDGIHPTPEGQAIYARTVKRALHAD